MTVHPLGDDPDGVARRPAFRALAAGTAGAAEVFASRPASEWILDLVPRLPRKSSDARPDAMARSNS
jgi:hypothetical protein